MAIAPPASLNGRPRKQLSDQLDRLDDVINGMEELLPQAVADAARDGIRQAFRDVLGELAADPALLDRLRAAVTGGIAGEAAPPAPKVSLFAKLRDKLRAAGRRIACVTAGMVRRTAAAPKRLTTAAVSGFHTVKIRLARTMLPALPVKSTLTVGLIAGLAVALLCAVAPRSVATVVSGLGAGLSAMGLHIANWFRRRRFALIN